MCLGRLPYGTQQAGKFDETMGLLDAMVKNGSPPSLAIFKVVLESCVIQKKADKVRQKISHFARLRVAVDTVWLGSPYTASTPGNARAAADSFSRKCCSVLYLEHTAEGHTNFSPFLAKHAAFANTKLGHYMP